MGWDCGQLFQELHVKAECCHSLKGEEETEPWKNWDFLRWEFVGDLGRKFRLGKAAEPELGCCGTAEDKGENSLQHLCGKCCGYYFTIALFQIQVNVALVV